MWYVLWKKLYKTWSVCLFEGVQEGVLFEGVQEGVFFEGVQEGVLFVSTDSLVTFFSFLSVEDTALIQKASNHCEFFAAFSFNSNTVFS